MILELDNLMKHFPIKKGLGLRRAPSLVKAVDGVSFAIPHSGTFGLVGESGCGKTTLAKLVLLLEKPSGGAIRFEGQDVSRFSASQVKAYRRHVQAVFQDPFSSLDPRMRVGRILKEPISAHNAMTRREAAERIAELLDIVKLPPDSAQLYPHEFSGGQRQRVAVARALALNSKLIVLDEPVSALDVSIRSQILNLLADIQERFGLTYLIIAHDLALVQHVSNAVGVMYLGNLVETGPADEVFENPLHPYTRALLAAVPRPDPDYPKTEAIIAGEVPSPVDPPPGCKFRPRCALATDRCAERFPPLVEASSGHHVACYLASS